MACQGGMDFSMGEVVEIGVMLTGEGFAKGELHVLVCHWRSFQADLIAELVISLWDDDLQFASLIAIADGLWPEVVQRGRDTRSA